MTQTTAETRNKNAVAASRSWSLLQPIFILVFLKARIRDYPLKGAHIFTRPRTEQCQTDDVVYLAHADLCDGLRQRVARDQDDVLACLDDYSRFIEETNKAGSSGDRFATV